MSEHIEFTTRNILERTAEFKPSVGIILGSGLGGLVSEINIKFTFPYDSVPGFPVSTVDGHPGNLIFGELGGKNVVVLQGRFHVYEGYSMEQIAFPLRVMQAMGVKTLCVSNACGGMNPDFEVGDLIIINDHINLFPGNPLIGKNDPSVGPRFVDMSQPYNKQYITTAKEIAKENGIRVREGVYAGLTGPCFETPAEYRMLWRLGADVVGMSTVPEVIVAKHAGMEVFAIGIITDLGIEGRVDSVTHEEVQHVAMIQEPKLSLIIKELIARI
jgi:purine-nucleoside phosphorylase